MGLGAGCDHLRAGWVSLLVVGLIAVLRAGVDGPIADPVVKVLGFTHTATLGFVEIGAGLFLLVTGAARSRSGAIFGGLALVVAGLVGAVQTNSFDGSLALESGLAWLGAVVGAVVGMAALLLPRSVRRSAVVEHR